MHISPRTLPMAALLSLSALAAPALADDCDTVKNAMAKAAQTPHRLDTVRTSAAPGSKLHETHAVVMDRTMFVLVNGTWQAMPYDPVGAMNSGLAPAGTHACKRLRDEAVDGEPAAVYALRNVTEYGAVDMQIWISSARGLPLRQTKDEPQTKSQDVARFDYANVKAPVAAR